MATNPTAQAAANPPTNPPVVNPQPQPPTNPPIVNPQPQTTLFASTPSKAIPGVILRSSMQPFGTTTRSH